MGRCVGRAYLFRKLVGSKDESSALRSSAAAASSDSWGGDSRLVVVQTLSASLPARRGGAAAVSQHAPAPNRMQTRAPELGQRSGGGGCAVLSRPTRADAHRTSPQVGGLEAAIMGHHRTARQRRRSHRWRRGGSCGARLARERLGAGVAVAELRACEGGKRESCETILAGSTDSERLAFTGRIWGSEKMCLHSRESFSQGQPRPKNEEKLVRGGCLAHDMP